MSDYNKGSPQPVQNPAYAKCTPEVIKQFLEEHPGIKFSGIAEAVFTDMEIDFTLIKEASWKIESIRNTLRDMVMTGEVIYDLNRSFKWANGNNPGKVTDGK